MLKKIIIVVFFLITSSCGYQAMYSKKNIINYDFSISNINFEGDRVVNLKIEQGLNNYLLNEKKKIFMLNIKTKTERLVLAKDVAGNATSFESIIKTYVAVYVGNNLKTNLQIDKKFKYNNISNKFTLQSYEKNLKVNLAESITQELTFKLSNIQ